MSNFCSCDFCESLDHRVLQAIFIYVLQHNMDIYFQSHLDIKASVQRVSCCSKVDRLQQCFQQRWRLYNKAPLWRNELHAMLVAFKNLFITFLEQHFFISACHIRHKKMPQGHDLFSFRLEVHINKSSFKKNPITSYSQKTTGLKKSSLVHLLVLTFRMGSQTQHIYGRNLRPKWGDPKFETCFD